MARWWSAAAVCLALAACDDGGAAKDGADPDAAAQADAARPDAAQPDAALQPDAAAPDAAPQPDAAAPDAAPEVDAAPPRAITGLLYEDGDGSDESVYASAFDEAHDHALAGAHVTLVGPDGEQQATTGADGRYAFDGLADGTWLVAPDVPDGERCSRRNCPKRFTQAVRAGHVKIVTFGDSIPKIGDPPFFPDRLATLLGDLATVDSVNVAVPGSTSEEWLPGASHFEQRLRPQIGDADLVLISIGGNDIVNYAANPALLRDIPGAIRGAHDLVQHIVGNIVTIIDAIRAVNPTVDVAFCLYVNYSQSHQQQIWVLATRLLGADNIRDILESARRGIPAGEDIMLVDLFGAAVDLPLDDYLYDPLHFNDLGQTFYAEEILRTLGGVHVGASPLHHGRASYGADQSWSFTPAR
jgi:lysophospholipase L1-like esterase